MGDFRSEIPRYLADVLRQTEGDGGAQQESSFYLNSSDSLATLLDEDFEGKRVLTVSGSGEFAHTFIHGGATEVCNFDISPAAAFFSELRHVSLCTLDMIDYVGLLGGWAKRVGSDETIPLLDREIYKKVEDSLSEEAQLFFKTLFDTPKLMNHAKGNNWYGFSRSRTNRKTRFNRLVGDVIKDEDEYDALQDKARKIEFTQVICDAKSMEGLAKSYNPNLIYLSNIGYEPAVTIGLAEKYIALGVPEVMCTISSNESEFNDPYSIHTEGVDKFYYDDLVLRQGSTFKYILRDKETYEPTEVTIKVVGTDRNADYGLALKLLSPKEPTTEI